MGVIQLKHGSQSAAPSSLLNGEFAINVDSNQLWYGSGSNNTPISDIRLNSITAEKYIISSSVTHMTTSFSSGSTEFGDSADDTHTFTGNITASGNIQIGNDAEITSLGNMTFRIDSDANEGSQTFTFRHNASTDIAELDESGVLTLYGNQLGQPAIELQQNTQTATFGPPVFIFNRTALASDNGDIGRFDFKANDDATNSTTYAQIIGQTEETGNGTEGGKITFKVASHDAELKTGLLIEDGDAEDEIDVTIGNTTTSLTTVAGNLSIGNSITSNITASGNISSSGTITANAFVGDITGDLTGNADTATALTAGNKTIDGNLSIGAAGGSAGHDLKLYGDTNNQTLVWDASEDFLKFTDGTKIVFGTGQAAADFDSSIQANGSNLVIYNDTGNIQIGDTVEITGNLEVTTNITSSANISSSGTVTADRFVGSQLTMVPWNYFVSSDHSDELYIPQGGSQVEVNSDQPYNFMLAPYDGKVRRLSVFYQTGDPGTLTARVRAAAAPFDLDDADDIKQALTQTGTVDDTAYFFDFSASFSKGDAVAVTLEAADHLASSYVVGCIAVEYDTTT